MLLKKGFSMRSVEDLRRIVAEELITNNPSPLSWLKALEETEFADDGSTKKAYLRLRIEELDAEELRPLIDAGLAHALEESAQGNAAASFRIYMVGQKILTETELLKWLRLAAEQGDGEAQNILGLQLASAYCRGGQNSFYPGGEDEALKWLRLSVAQGNENAKSNLRQFESDLVPLNERPPLLKLNIKGTGTLQDINNAIKEAEQLAQQSTDL
jgi:TPR repeat protein